jgi:DnaJ-class molecular chaperone
LRLRGQGSPGWNGGAPGDALIEIHVAPHRFFKRDGQDIRMELPVTLSEAVLGGPIEAPTPAGSVRVRIPPGSDSGSELRLRGRGVPKHGGAAAGDLYATLRVVVGPPDDALKTFLEGLEAGAPGQSQAIDGATDMITVEVLLTQLPDLRSRTLSAGFQTIG